MIAETKIRKIAADAMRRLGYGDIGPNDVPADLVNTIDASFNQTGIVFLRLNRELSATESEAFVGSIIGLLAMLSDVPTNRKNAAKQLKAAAQVAAL